MVKIETKTLYLLMTRVHNILYLIQHLVILKIVLIEKLFKLAKFIYYAQCTIK